MFGGCVFTGKNIIHSPNAPGAIEYRLKHIHGGATKKSPPDIISIESTTNDSISLVVSAKFIFEKNNWGGIGFPFIPLFYLPKIDSYKNDPNTLTVFLLLSSNNETTILTDSISLVVDEKFYSPKRSSYTGSINFQIKVIPRYHYMGIIERIPMAIIPEIIQLDFPVSAKEVDQFELIIDGIFSEGKRVSFTKVNFKKVKQKFWFMGP